jgi:FkbM family methyltransferase
VDFRKFLALKVPRYLKPFLPEIVYKHLYFSGEFDFFYKGISAKLYNTSSIVENQIFWRGLDGSHEPKSIQVWIDLVRFLKPTRVLDIGANTGIYGALAKMFCPEADIHFFEPSPESKYIIEKVMEINNFQGYSIHNLALSDSDGVSNLFVANTKSGVPYTYVDASKLNVKREYRKVQIVRLDTLFKSLDLKEFQIVKIDVEGHEDAVLKGFGNLLRQNLVLLVEVLGEELAEKLSLLFAEPDYVFFNIDEKEKRLIRQEKLGPALKFNFLIVPSCMEVKLAKLLN